MSQLFFKKSQRRPSAFATLGLIVTFLAFVILLGAGPILGFLQQTSSVAAEVFLWRLKLLDLATLLLMVGSFVTIIGILHGRLSRRVRTSWRGFIAVTFAILVAIPLWFLERAKSESAALHDITTDISDPPYFRTLSERSYDTSAPYFMLGGRLDPNYIAKHRSAYSDLAPLQWASGPTDALNATERAARQLGWIIDAKSAQYGQLEAHVINPFLWLRTDIVIRAKPTPLSDGSTIDIRAVSPQGITDYGSNASLIRDFLVEMQREGP